MQSYAVVVGCGALGSVSACYLVRAGIGHIRIIDRDFIEECNLQRQILFDEEDIRNNLPKAVVAENKLKRVNSHVNIEGVVADVNHTNIEELVSGADIILDGTDNFETRFLINDVCVKHNIPWIYGACIGSKGLTMNIVPSETPCLRCVFHSLPQTGTFPTCNTAGIIGPIASIIASIQVTEAIKILIKDFESMSRRLFDIDVWNTKFRQLDVQALRKLNDCPACKLSNYEFLNAEEGILTTLLCGKNAIQITYRNVGKANIEQLAERLRSTMDVSCNEFMLRFKVDDIGFTLFPDGRAIITGTEDKNMAKGLYAKYLGM
ncbi:MAG: thiazole biosynthesis adenylyltransferase ThiF [Candidatus Scalindua sp.]|nr:MAG: thiazole biosynthesis adenylyltransferase ThiF [Candidatus Scalindua sp.]